MRARIKVAAVSVLQTVKGRMSISDRIAEFGGAVHGHLMPRFRQIAVAYPPKKIILVGLKLERTLEVWVADERGGFQFLKSYTILAASGGLGPKLAEGDRQVPEGLYQLEALNPNSLFHLALRVNYPNSFDKAKGQLDGRNALGSDIMIHGKATSVGCLAMGNEAAEDLFVLAAETGIENVRVILSPVDFRIRELPSGMPSVPEWTSELYAEIRQELQRFKTQPAAPPRATGAAPGVAPLPFPLGA
jgi:murein L,D-transpeptidase YafK